MKTKDIDQESVPILSILLVDDHVEWQKILQEDIRQAVEEMGRNSRIQISADFEDAWHALNNQGPWHLLITDLGLKPRPRQLLGKQLVQQASYLQIPTIVVSGTEPLNPAHVAQLYARRDSNTLVGFFWKPDFDDMTFVSSIQQIFSEESAADILLVTATEVESLAVLRAFREETGRDFKRQFIGDMTYHDLGNVGGAKVFMVQSEMGSGGPGGSLLTVQEGIRALSPSAVMMVGVAFGVNEQKQHIGDILISSRLLTYELQRVSTTSSGDLRIVPRGNRPEASTRLLDKFQSGLLDWKGANVKFGLILSGDKLVDNLDFRQQLLELGPEAIGGEMEGAGLYAAAQRSKVDWILVKAICDWADGTKNKNKKQRQEHAARNAARFMLHVLRQGGITGAV